jgi:fatty-acyl-CoA synthase
MPHSIPVAADQHPRIRSLDDLIAFEQTPWQQKLPARSTYQLLQQACERHPERTALRFVPSGAPDTAAFAFNYRTLLEKVTRAANAFHSAGVTSRDAVALLLPNLPETHFALLGAQAAGIANPINPMLDVEHIASIVNATGAVALVALAPLPDSDLWDKAVAVAERCPSLRTLFVAGMSAYIDPASRDALNALHQAAAQPRRAGLRVLPFDAALQAERPDRLASGRVIDGNDPCAYFHTGGTTGLPKVAVHTHLNETFVACMLGVLEPLPHVVMCGLPLFHVNGAMVTGLAAFHGGWEVVMLTPQGYRGKDVLPNFWRLVERFRATSFSGVPTVFAALASLPRDGADLSSLRHAFCGAAPLPAEVARRFEEAAGIPLCEGYGLTEAACVSALNPTGGSHRAGSVGLRLPHQALQVWQVDGSGLAVRACASGETGVIGIAGPNVFPGYLNSRDNAGIWLAPGWLNTGDLGYLDAEGFLHLTGRAKDLIIRGGHNIDPAMIEDALLGHPAVALAAAVGQPDEHAGELPMAYVTLKTGATILPEALLLAARKLVPERAAMPVRIEVLPQMALTAIGKVAKAELRMRAAAHVFRQRLGEHGIDAEVRVIADGQRGSVAVIQADAPQAERARAALARFGYAIDILPADGKEPA